MYICGNAAIDVIDHGGPDVYVAELYSIEEAGSGTLRLTFVTYQRSTTYQDRRKEAHVVLRLVMPADAVGRAAEASQLAMHGVEGIIRGVLVERNGAH